MGYAIELYFNFQFEEKIHFLWDELSEAGVPSILQRIGSRPHLSLAVMESCDEVLVSELLGKFIKKFPKFFIEFPAISLIPGEQQAVFLTPVPNLLILEMQRALFHILVKNGYFPYGRYEPNKWLPHCSISKELSSSDALKTTEICQNSSVTGMAKVIEAGIVEFRPRREIKTFNLKNNEMKFPT